MTTNSVENARFRTFPRTIIINDIPIDSFSNQRMEEQSGEFGEEVLEVGNAGDGISEKKGGKGKGTKIEEGEH